MWTKMALLECKTMKNMHSFFIKPVKHYECDMLLITVIKTIINIFTFISERQLFSVKNCVIFVRHFNSSIESMLFSDMFNTHKLFCQKKRK